MAGGEYARMAEHSSKERVRSTRKNCLAIVLRAVRVHPCRRLRLNENTLTAQTTDFMKR